MIVLDANVALKLVVEQAGTDRAQAVLASGQGLLAPALYVGEITTTLRKYERAGAISGDHARSAVTALIDCITVMADDRALAAPAYELSSRLDHSPYDCFYLALALERDATLVTADTKFAAKVAKSPYAPHVVLLRDWKG